MEIERKFLADIKDMPFELESLEKFDMCQCYISTNPTIRIRKSNESYILTVKSKGTLYREEFEMPIDKEQYENLLKKSETPILKKIRYIHPLNNNLLAEIDVYDGELKGLITIEVEFETVNEAEAFKPPLWFGEDITEKNEYNNSNLALHGLKKI